MTQLRSTCCYTAAWRRHSPARCLSRLDVAGPSPGVCRPGRPLAARSRGLRWQKRQPRCGKVGRSQTTHTCRGLSRAVGCNVGGRRLRLWRKVARSASVRTSNGRWTLVRCVSSASASSRTLARPPLAEPSAALRQSQPAADDTHLTRVYRGLSEAVLVVGDCGCGAGRQIGVSRGQPPKFTGRVRSMDVSVQRPVRRWRNGGRMAHA